VFFIIETLLLFIITIRLTGFLSIFLLIAFFQQKRKQHTSNEEWESYFTKLGANGILWRLYVCFFVVLCAFAIVYTFYFWHRMWVYGITLILAGVFHLYFKYRLNKEQIRVRFLK
jgi:Flp pilus assembly protein TadB